LKVSQSPSEDIKPRKGEVQEEVGAVRKKKTSENIRKCLEKVGGESGRKSPQKDRKRRPQKKKDSENSRETLKSYSKRVKSWPSRQKDWR